MAVRLSTLAEIKVMSLSAYLRDGGVDFQDGAVQDILNQMASYRRALGNGDSDILQALKNADNTHALPFFKTIGLARSVRIDEDFGTTNIYGIGAPTRPRIVPNNVNVNVSAERLQLDRKDLRYFITSPEYWYSDSVQRNVGIDDFLLYTYMFVKSKEDTGEIRHNIYALMPRTSSKAVTSGDVMVANNVSLVGFKYSYEQAWLDTENLVDESLTASDPRTPGD